MTQWCQRGDKSQGCGVGQSWVSVSALSEAAALVYLSSACNYKWSQFDGSSNAPHRDISYSSHNAVIDVLEPVGRYGDDSTVPISSERSDIPTEFLLRRQHQYLTPPRTNHMWGTSYAMHGGNIVRIHEFIVRFHEFIYTALILNTHCIFGTVRKEQLRTPRPLPQHFVSENLGIRQAEIKFILPEKKLHMVCFKG